MTPSPERIVLQEGKYLRFVRRGTWEYVERTKISGIVGILAVTGAGKIILCEQYRPPLQTPVIELPAGLAGDVAGTENEPLTTAAARELFEETGYEADRIVPLTEGVVSAGVTDEVINLYLATGLRKTGSGGGDAHENIKVHEVPLENLCSWLAVRQREGARVDLKIFSALYCYELRKTANKES
jgi:ADP-ribose pyrophosphatase